VQDFVGAALAGDPVVLAEADAAIGDAVQQFEVMGGVDDGLVGAPSCSIRSTSRYWVPVQVLSGAQNEDDGDVRRADGVGMKMPRRAGPAGRWCSWCRGAAYSVVTSATAARALDSSTMALLVA
jgi:hypothetical protein